MSPSPKEMLDTMLGYLGFICEIKEMESERGLTLQVYSSEGDRLIGRRGETLEDIQFLLNRMLQSTDRSAPRVTVDVEHYRQMRDDSMLHRVQQVAEIVRKSGRPLSLDPMNSYDRRIVHHAFQDDPEITTWSPQDGDRMKRITLKRREQAGEIPS